VWISWKLKCWTEYCITNKTFCNRGVSFTSRGKPLLVQLTVVILISQFDVHCLQLDWKWPKKYYTQFITVAVRFFSSTPTYIYYLQHTVFLPLDLSVIFPAADSPISNMQSVYFASACSKFLLPKAIITEGGTFCCWHIHIQYKKNICIKIKPQNNLKAVVLW
jgi:hypothetical protein